MLVRKTKAEKKTGTCQKDRGQPANIGRDRDKEADTYPNHPGQPNSVGDGDSSGLGNDCERKGGELSSHHEGRAWTVWWLPSTEKSDSPTTIRFAAFSIP
jgi:hypothetical protein